ncbi:recombinase family protein [Staphylococcus aureus]|uniref:cassette chromosome recombinase CcrC n=1 Tax=Staphylococcaceae TaxID=90964 RepID=UPI000D1C7CFA|nr:MULTISPECIES: recombinase family protein [Staphylococcaceae]PTF28056.1 recombinase RecB [Staphylococcus cohnii]WPF96819.1 recombinase family protein [Staphylococcus aureus]WPF99327.1 recombinase family protein [Staphylococcus aureus]HDG4011110.1 recombinase family protein [Staphylococcus aureus]HDG4013336.1 recombinase family protein [Staphylococcus aureus]
MNKKIALYSRVSTSEQSERGYSIHEQEQVLIKEVLKHFPGYEYQTYTDSGISGKNIQDRPAMKRLLDDVKANKIEIVLSWKLNRISRSMRDVFNIIHDFKEHGVGYKSISENIDTSEYSGEILVTMFGLIGSIERQTLISNVKMSMNAKARQGEAITGRVLGYKLSLNPLTQKNDLVIDEHEANIVKEIFDLYLNHNKGLKAITTILNQRGYRTINHKPFSVFGVKYILNNPVYKGFVRFNNYQNWSTKRRSGKSGENDVILVKGKHEAIISEEMFDQVHEKLVSKSFKPGRPIGGDFYLRGLIKCPECGNNMVCRRTYYNTKKSKERTIKRYYICSLFNRSGSAACHSNSIKAEVVEAVIHKHLNIILSQPEVVGKICEDVIENIKHKQTAPIEAVDDIDTLKRQKHKIKTQQERLLELFLDDQMDSTLLSEKQKELNVQLATIEEKIKTAHNQQVNQPVTMNYKVLKVRLIMLMNRFSASLKKADPEAKNQLMKMLIDSIEITKDKQVKLIRYKIDETLIPQSLKKDWGTFFMPQFHFVIDDKNKCYVSKFTTFTT